MTDVPETDRNPPLFSRHGEIDRLLREFTRKKVLVVGDFMLDRYIWGQAERISPEAPVQVVRVERETATLGGAGNVANNLAGLNSRTFVAGVVGDDEAADRMVRFFRGMNVDTDGLFHDPERITTQKTRICAGQQQIVRVDREEVRDIGARFAERIVSFVAERADVLDGMLVSDYGKGTLSPDLTTKLIDLMRSHSKPVVVDPKGVAYEKYRGATMITPNLKELGAAVNMPVTDTDGIRRAVQALRERVGDCMILVTRGKDGMTLFRPNKEEHHIPARTREVFDVSGAGDTVLAVAGLGLIAGLDPVEAARTANTAAGVVVGKVGTAPISAEELREAVWSETYPGLRKFRGPEEMATLASSLKKQGKEIVFTNGCFDLLHAGHIRILELSKSLGDVLIVALDSDRSVREVKGQGRPVLSENERVKIISALDTVDFVTVFPPDGLKSLLEALRPDVLTKGANYAEDQVEGREIVELHGGRIRLIRIEDELSVSGLIRRILNTSDRNGSND